MNFLGPSFQKKCPFWPRWNSALNFQNMPSVFKIKKANCIFEELSNIYFIVLLIIFFILFCGLYQKLEPSWRNYLFELQDHAEHDTTNIQTAPNYLSATAIMLVILWTERNFCIFSDWRNSFTTNLKTYCYY